ncbi:hypothetical protein I545_5294 [Mycobacterium kansasii 662]|uniref:Archease domain-containing protein n=2 Tax=Mycobacterium kansasii TaxID=1768 RepID=A0A1V3WFQ1_MYCKA|nr:hypothetical protein I547_1618 [Mycobacterium kansasii 824]EUA11818.1 hypothetical protein I545_5294 [Mycobacterium kansasii 662]KEP44071.1 hypothetical protein MKSMC1_08270 [Mycobacterium kansasii]OOK65608.1 hypothetical protein BZL30_8691 [Mycobacterium kansasii]
MLGVVESFLDTSSAPVQQTRRRRVTANSDDSLLVAALDEVIYLLDTTGQAPVELMLSEADGGVDMTLEMVDAGAVPQVGAVPKAVSLNDLCLVRGEHGWRCSVTVDV